MSENLCLGLTLFVKKLHSSMTNSINVSQGSCFLLSRHEQPPSLQCEFLQFEKSHIPNSDTSLSSTFFHLALSYVSQDRPIKKYSQFYNVG